MGHIFYQLARWLGLLSPAEYHYPAMDIQLPGDRHLHLVGSIHMGTMNMQPLPDILLKRLSQADALIVEADISEAESPFGIAEDLSPLSERLTEQQYLQVESLCEELGVSVRQKQKLRPPKWCQKQSPPAACRPLTTSWRRNTPTR